MEDNFTRSFFDENSKRAKMGLEFQAKALEEFLASGAIAKSVPEWLKLLDPDLSDSQVWKLEKTWGDIVIKKKDGSRIFIECVTSSGETTPFPLSKSENFSGKNKWYLFGWEDERHFVPSVQWNSWVSKREKVESREKDFVAIVRRKNYASMRCGTNGLQKFCVENDLI
jgi:hypothetical protein